MDNTESITNKTVSEVNGYTDTDNPRKVFFGKWMWMKLLMSQ